LTDDTIQNIVNQLSQDISKDALFRDRLRKIIIRTFLLSFILTLLGVGLYMFYLKYTLEKVQQELSIKNSRIDDLEASLNSLMYAEQLREENLLSVSGYLLDEKENTNLEKQVLENLKKLEEISMGYQGENILRGNLNYPEIALTFDMASGQELGYIEGLIRKYNIHLTIFLSNERASELSGSFFIRSNLDSIKRLARLGNVEFGNHTWSHYNYVKSVHETSLKKRKTLEYISSSVLTIEQMAEELNRVEVAFKELTDSELTKYYRLPYGALNSLILNTHAALGYPKHIMWSSNSVGSLDIPDYIYKQFITKKDPTSGKVVIVKNPFYKTSRETLDFLYEWERKDPKGMNGAIILFHLGSPRKFDRLILILPEFIETMQAKGYHFRKLSEVLNDNPDF